MNIISIGTDRKIFEEGSPVRERMIEYGKLFTELHIIVFSKADTGLEAWRIADNVWIYPTNSFSKFMYMRDGVALAKKVIQLRKFTPETTIVTTQDPFETGKVGAKLKAIYKFPLQVQVHTDLFSPYFRSSFLNKIRVRFAQSVLPQANEIRVVSERIKHSLMEKSAIVADKIDVLPIYIDMKKFDSVPEVSLKSKYPQFSPLILMASRFAPEKNIGSGIEIFSEVLKKYPKAGLVIVGEGAEESKLKKLIKKFGVQASVVFKSWQPDLGGFLKTSDIFLSTSLFEGYGLALAEAAYCGVPIVTSDVGIAGNILIDGKSAGVCPVNNVECFVGKISSLIDNSEMAANYISQAKESIVQNLIQDKQEYLEKYKSYLERAASIQ